MRIIADTNLLIRTLVADDPAQTLAAQEALDAAARIAFPLTMLCEVTWVLKGVYGFSSQALQLVLENVLATRNADLDRPAVEAGLVLLRTGGDFADGVIAHEGRVLGGEVFVSFDRKATRLLEKRGLRAKLLRGR